MVRSVGLHFYHHVSQRTQLHHARPFSHTHKHTTFDVRSTICSVNVDLDHGAISESPLPGLAFEAFRAGQYGMKQSTVCAAVLQPTLSPHSQGSADICIRPAMTGDR